MRWGLCVKPMIRAVVLVSCCKIELGRGEAEWGAQNKRDADPELDEEGRVPEQLGGAAWPSNGQSTRAKVGEGRGLVGTGEEEKRIGVLAKPQMWVVSSFTSV
jgi:hypothetical protein